MSLPKMLQYRSVKPQGFPSEFKRFEVLPQSLSQNYNLNDVIRFQFKTDWFFDPFQTYMQIEVEFPQSAQNMGLQTVTYKSTGYSAATDPYQKRKLNDIPVFILDGPATSLIDEMIVYSNGIEIERLQSYDIVGNMIADLGLSALTRQNKKFEGYGFPGLYKNQCQPESYSFKDTGTALQQNNSQFIQGDMFTNIFSFGYTDDAANTITNNQASVRGMFDLAWNYNNPFDYNLTTIGDITQKTGVYSFPYVNQFKNYAREYILCDGSMGVDHQETYNTNPYPLLSTATSASINTSIGLQDWVSGNSSATYFVSAKNKCFKANKRCLFNFDSSLNHFDYICPGIQAQKWYNGAPVLDVVRGAAESISLTDTGILLKYGIYKKTFNVPILSGVMGHLIPSDEWKLIPGFGCGELTWEFRINKYAFFTSGHLDNDFFTSTNEADLSRMPAKQFTIDWKITKIALKFDLWRFDQTTTQTLKSQVDRQEGVIINSQGFVNGPVQQLASGAQVRNVYQINNGILSLKNMYLLFISNDYLKYNFCRKNFRLSHCIKSLQLKMGNDFLPKQPILGNAGNITSPLLNNDVNPFLMELYRSCGDMFNITNQCTISPFSFMLNERAYNIDNREHTKNQMALLHETRLCGKAIYTIDTTADPFDQSVLTGLDTRKLRPIELLIDNDQTIPHPRPSTMYIILHHDSIVQFTSKGVIVTAYG